MNLTITVTKDELLQAAENLIYEQLDEDTLYDNDAIASIIKNHIELKIEDIISNPENHLNSEELSRVNKFVYLTDKAYKKVMNRDIPYPAKFHKKKV